MKLLILSVTLAIVSISPTYRCEEVRQKEIIEYEEEVIQLLPSMSPEDFKQGGSL